MRNKVLIVMALVLVSAIALVGCSAPGIASYTIPMIDLEENVIKSGDVQGDEVLYKFGDDVLKNEKYATMFGHKTVVATPTSVNNNNMDKGEYYLGHPDSILLKRNGAYTDEILTMYPLGHGKGELNGMYSFDGGLTYTTAMTNTPKSWLRSMETPTLYRLKFDDNDDGNDDDLIILISGNPRWPGGINPNGFNVSISAPSLDANGDKVEAREWSEFETWYGNGNQGDTPDAYLREPRSMMRAADCIVAMSSLTRLKDTATGVFKDEWMGLFHDHGFNCYKTILTFAEPTEAEIAAKVPTYNIEGVQKVMHWSEPEMYFNNDVNQYRKIQRKTQMCEVECVRSDAGKGNELALITRSNSKNTNSLISFSTDEGITWSTPRELPAALNGERHKAEWVKVGEENKLFITFRSIERGTAKVGKYAAGSNWMSEGYVAWVGDWDDLKTGTEGDFRVKLAHTYLDGQDKAQRSANGDTGYAGNVVLPDGKVATCSYGRFSKDADKNLGKHTYILGKVVDVAALYELVAMIPAKA